MNNTVRLHASAEDLSKDYLTPCKCNIYVGHKSNESFLQRTRLIRSFFYHDIFQKQLDLRNKHYALFSVEK